MKFPQPIPVSELARQINARIIGDATLSATGINEIHQVEKGDITFVDVKKYFDKSLKSAATVILLNEETDCPEGKVLLLCEQPFEAYNQIVLAHRPVLPQTQPISATAQIHPTAIIEPNVIIGHHVHIGAHSYIQANTTIAEYSIIGANVVVHPNCIIGSDAFYFKRTEAGYQPWRSCGRTIIEDSVRIGAGCTINKGVSGDTIIGEGSQLDCQVHIGHDAKVGKRCLLAAQVGIGGNTVVEDEVVLYGQVGVAQNVTIGAKAIVMAKSGVSKSLEGGKVYFGYPANETKVVYRELAAVRQLPEFLADYHKKNGE